MVDALRQQHKDVEWVEFDDEGHSLGFTENRRIWSNKVFALLKRTIGPGIPPAKMP
jgi:dipeptidyl aminopeptidase/acylaminoacyl peptidase